MRQYETTFIVDAHLPGDQIETTIEKITKFIDKKGGKVLNIDRWGKRRLAYEIRKKQYGYYIYVRFEAENTFVKELEREYQLDESILRYLTLLMSRAALKEENRRQSIRKHEKADEDTDLEEDTFDSGSDDGENNMEDKNEDEEDSKQKSTNE